MELKKRAKREGGKMNGLTEDKIMREMTWNSTFNFNPPICSLSTIAVVLCIVL